MRVKYLAQEHNAVPQLGLEPRLLGPKSSALTIRSPRLPFQNKSNYDSSSTEVSAERSLSSVGKSFYVDFEQLAHSWYVFVSNKNFGKFFFSSREGCFLLLLVILI